MKPIHLFPFFLSLIPLAHAHNGDKGHGGDAVRCAPWNATKHANRGWKPNAFRGTYVLDRLYSSMKAGEDAPRMTTEEIISALSDKLPAWGRRLSQFHAYFGQENPGAPFDWAPFGALIPIDDEDLDFKLPPNCQAKPVQFVQRSGEFQFAPRSGASGSVLFKYDPKVMDEIEKAGQETWIEIHEFLWDQTLWYEIPGAKGIRIINDYLHDARPGLNNLKNDSPEEVRKFLLRNGINPKPPAIEAPAAPRQRVSYAFRPRLTSTILVDRGKGETVYYEEPEYYTIYDGRRYPTGRTTTKSYWKSTPEPLTFQFDLAKEDFDLQAILLRDGQKGGCLTELALATKEALKKALPEIDPLLKESKGKLSVSFVPHYYYEGKEVVYGDGKTVVRNHMSVKLSEATLPESKLRSAKIVVSLKDYESFKTPFSKGAIEIEIRSDALRREKSDSCAEGFDPSAIRDAAVQLSRDYDEYQRVESRTDAAIHNATDDRLD